MDSNHGGQSSYGSQNPMQTFGIPEMEGAESVGKFGQPQKSENSGIVNSNNAQRQTAAKIARNKVLAAYGHAANGNQAEGADRTPYVQKRETNPIQASVNAAVARNGAHLKNQPMMARRTTDDIRKYHTAWQNYYQKYYSEYYANAARNYVEKERLKDARKQAEDREVLDALGKGKEAEEAIREGSKASDEIDDIGAKLKKTIRKKAVKNVKKSRRMRRWVPFLAGAFVVLLILFLQYNRLIFAPIFAYVSPGNVPANQIEAIDPTITQTVSADPRLIIPKLNIDVPIAFGVGLDDVMSAMENGVAHYRIAGASAYPGEIGNTVITGHSAGDVYSSNPYKYIFSGLERLEDGDLIYINYQSVRYTYQVTGKEVIEPTNVQALVLDTDKPMLTLVTCTPLGTSRYRLLVFAEQIAPNVEDAEEADTIVNIDTSEGEEMPANEPSFFEGIWNFLTGKNN